MIGVIANLTEHGVVREFFELFKTPWEFYRSDRRYEVLLCAGDAQFCPTAAKLVIIYASSKTLFDAEEEIDSQRRSTILSYKGGRIPIYEGSITFRHKGFGILTDEISQGSAGYLQHSNGSTLARMGYHLFREVHTLLTVGQPTANASIPTLDMHIALLQDLIIGCGVPLVEIPPIPGGYRFIACLTIDVHHPAIRHHKWDHTMFGFLYRAVIGSLIEVFRRRVPVRHLFTNWAAALMLPLVYLGLAKDFWSEFDRYLEIEKGLCSTFFVIPFKNCPGQSAAGPAPRIRASSYAARDIADHLRRFVLAGCEVGLHGINAWLDSSKGREELDEIARITGVQSLGVRMHWLYFDDHSPLALEKAGFSYDSTMGYNETVGYRAGTSQAFKPLQATRLLELPLHVMDTALFFPSHLNLSAKEAGKLVRAIIDNAPRFGGVVTVNWHDRSIAPERLWDRFYMDLVSELRSRGPWFATARQAVSWFRRRRSVVFERAGRDLEVIRAKVSLDSDDEVPALRLRLHNPVGVDASRRYVDTPLTNSIDVLPSACGSMQLDPAIAYPR